MEKLKNVIKGRTCAIMSHGGSIKELEDRIGEFKDYDICWTSLNYFTIMDDFILSKIDKSLDIVYDSSTVAEDFRLDFNKVRMERIGKYLEQGNNLWVTTHGLIRDDVKGLGYYPAMEKHLDKICVVDNIFPKDNIPHYMSVPGSMTLLIASLIAGGAKKIIMFGFDGYNGSVDKGIDFYFKPYLQREERRRALGTLLDYGINRDTGNFKIEFPRIKKEYDNLFGSNVEIINCSPGSTHTILETVNYDEVKKHLTN